MGVLNNWALITTATATPSLVRTGLKISNSSSKLVGTVKKRFHFHFTSRHHSKEMSHQFLRDSSMSFAPVFNVPSFNSTSTHELSTRCWLLYRHKWNWRHSFSKALSCFSMKGKSNLHYTITRLEHFTHFTIALIKKLQKLFLPRKNTPNSKRPRWKNAPLWN